MKDYSKKEHLNPMFNLYTTVLLSRKGSEDVMFDLVNIDLPSTSRGVITVMFQGLEFHDKSNALKSGNVSMRLVLDNYLFNYKFMMDWLKESVEKDVDAEDNAVILFYEPTTAKIKINREIYIPNMVLNDVSGIGIEYINDKPVSIFNTNYNCGLININ
jgi:hypothetical protein